MVHGAQPESRGTDAGRWRRNRYRYGSHRLSDRSRFRRPSPHTVEPECAEAMGRMMRDIMGLHYGVLMYSRLLDEDGKSPVVVARGSFLREQRGKYPDRASVLDARIAGNERLQAALADPAEIARHVDEARLLVGRIDHALSQTRFVSDDSYTLADTFATAARPRHWRCLRTFPRRWARARSPASLSVSPPSGPARSRRLR
jgi:hypothetical protein